MSPASLQTRQTKTERHVWLGWHAGLASCLLAWRFLDSRCRRCEQQQQETTGPTRSRTYARVGAVLYSNSNKQQ